jgi:fructuronate reductase
VLAAYVCHLRGTALPVDDVRAAELTAAAEASLPEAVRRVLAILDPEAADDDSLAELVVAEAEAPTPLVGALGLTLVAPSKLRAVR